MVDCCKFAVSKLAVGILVEFLRLPKAIVAIVVGLRSGVKVLLRKEFFLPEPLAIPRVSSLARSFLWEFGGASFLLPEAKFLILLAVQENALCVLDTVELFQDKFRFLPPTFEFVPQSSSAFRSASSVLFIPPVASLI